MKKFSTSSATCSDILTSETGQICGCSITMAYCAKWTAVVFGEDYLEIILVRSVWAPQSLESKAHLKVLVAAWSQDPHRFQVRWPFLRWDHPGSISQKRWFSTCKFAISTSSCTLQCEDFASKNNRANSAATANFLIRYGNKHLHHGSSIDTVLTKCHLQRA